MLELYQFEMSHYSEKVRLILDYKGLTYRKIEVTPGIGQLELFRMSGQRQVPVLKDGNEIVVDSTAIAKYLDRKYPEKPIIPVNPEQRGQCLLIEEWADESIGLKARKALFGALSQNQSFRTSVLPPTTPDFVKLLVGAVPGDFFNLLGSGIGFGPDVVKSSQEDLKQDLEAVSLLLLNKPYLVTDYPTLADFAVAGLSMYIKIPEGPYLEIPETLKGKGVPGLADSAAYETFFNWRDRLYAQYRKQPTPTTTTTPSSPTSIEID
ncbi:MULTISPECIES: glutathione S-transferase family protein [Aerosakkonema]|uniref:glutathione S-transferase family protein n=1 Tax=Aerosakkonema TaxID=1246629 RepID=UPI0035B7BFAD